MKTYNTNEDGSLTVDNMTIPKGHRFYDQALAEVEVGEAEILPYAKPAPTAEELAAPHRAYLASTDWYVVRATETGAPVPQDILSARSIARQSI